MTVSEVMDVVLRDEVFYRHSGGGLTIGGGEPTVWPEFLTDLLKAATEKGLHTTIETCGYAEWKVLETVLLYTGLFLYDLKHMDDSAHKRLTGRSNQTILANLARLVENGAKVLVRMPVIPGFNDGVENLMNTAGYVKSLGLKTMNLLPYHNYGSVKYPRLGKKYALPDVKCMAIEDLWEHKKLIEVAGLECILG
jgi:pyruvate formate lyase activating enzyme